MGPRIFKILRFVLKVPPLRWLALVLFLVLTMAAFVAVSLSHLTAVTVNKLFAAAHLHHLANLFWHLSQWTERALDFFVTLYDRAERIRKLVEAMDAMGPPA